VDVSCVSVHSHAFKSRSWDHMFFLTDSLRVSFDPSHVVVVNFGLSRSISDRQTE